MQIIDIGMCVDNIDPKGLGRIRYRPYSLYVSEITMGIEYKDWDEKDPFIAIPFLPHHINIIPQVKQSVKLVRYDTSKTTQNVEYVAGPFSSPHDVQNQTFTSQHTDTTYGAAIVKQTKDIRNSDGVFNSPTTEGTMINERDTGFRGNYGSDAIFTENGVQLRGGALLAKQGKKKESLLNYPQMAKKMGRLSLKKFPKTFNAVKETVTTETIAVSRIKYIIEYEIDDLTTPTQLSLFVYKVLPGYGEQFNTDVFGADSVFNHGDTNLVKLINTGNTTTDASYIQSLNGTIQGGYVEFRELLHLIDEQGLTVLDATYPNEIVYPFYFRPTSNFQLTKGSNSTEITNKETFLGKIMSRNRTISAGLVYSKNSADPPITESSKIVDTVKEAKSGGEQSFSNLSADKVYITSTSPNVGKNIRTINFTELNEYELTQEDYLSKIEPNTYALVRGDILYKLLTTLKKAYDSHIHNINDTPVKTEDNYEEFNRLMDTLRDDLLNDSLRIN